MRVAYALFFGELANWLTAADVPPCHHQLGEVWADGCCTNRRGRLVRFRLRLWLLLDTPSRKLSLNNIT